MYAYQLRALVEGDRVMKAKFLGIFSKNTLPHLKRGQAFIANTQNSSRVGRHWLLLYYKNNVLYFLDPLAKPPQYYGREFVECIRLANPRKVVKLCKPVQDEKTSDLCGYFNILFYYFLVRDYPLSYILLEILRQEPHKNDAIVRKFINEQFGFRV